MSLLHPPVASPRPVEVTYISEATFADILDIGVAQLAVRDATVIERITEPGYEDFIGRMSELGRTSIWRVPKSYVDDQPLVLSPQRRLETTKQPQYKHIVSGADVKADEFYMNIRSFYSTLRSQTGESTQHPVMDVSVEPGQRTGSLRNQSTQSRHNDRNVDNINQATLNFTLYTASILPWIWRLTPSGTVETSWAVDLPLEAGGCIILGDKARRGRFGYQTVDHEVLSPPSSHRGDDVKRIRLLAYN